MKFLNATLLTLAVSMGGLFNTVNAQVIDNDTYTTVNGLDWLDWSFSIDLAQEEAVNKFNQDGYGNAFRLATHDEAIGMLEGVYFDTYGEDIPWGGENRILHQAGDSAEFTIDMLNLFGSSNTPESMSNTIRSYGYINDNAYGVSDGDWIFGGSASFNSSQGGIALVRVPAPATSFLFVLLMAGLTVRQYKKHSSAEKCLIKS